MRDEEPRWHPIMSAVEDEPGRWRMVDSLGQGYGEVELRRVGTGELRYRVTKDGELIGWAISLRVACEKLNRIYLDAMGPQGIWTAYHQPRKPGDGSAGRSTSA